MGRFQGVILLALIGVLLSWLFHKFGFFSKRKKDNPHVEVRYPLIGFGIYCVLFFVIAPLAIKALFTELHEIAVPMTVAQLISVFTIALFFVIYSRLQPKGTNKVIWKGNGHDPFSTHIKLFGLGVISWLIAFPATTVIGELSEVVTRWLFDSFGMEQLAVRYLRLVAKSPTLLTCAIFSIVIAAPILEELIFRGFMQTWLKQKWSFIPALILSSLIFALFHFSPSQGPQNLPLIVSFFTLSLFLGFLYEREKSLLAPIGLHMTFNSISVIRILLQQ